MKKDSEAHPPHRKSSRRPLIKADEYAARALAAASDCPSLAHWVGRDRGEPFDQARLQVLEWFTGHPDIRLWLLRTIARSGAIVFDAHARKWSEGEVSS